MYIWEKIIRRICKAGLLFVYTERFGSLGNAYSVSFAAGAADGG